MWLKFAKIFLNIWITSGILISLLIAGIGSAIWVLIGYASKQQNGLIIFIIIAIINFIITLIFGIALTYISASAYGLITEIAENTAKIEENTRLKQQMQVSDTQKYSCR